MTSEVGKYLFYLNCNPNGKNSGTTASALSLAISKAVDNYIDIDFSVKRHIIFNYILKIEY
jgi:hypothetical protein